MTHHTYSGKKVVGFVFLKSPRKIQRGQPGWKRSLGTEFSFQMTFFNNKSDPAPAGNNCTGNIRSDVTTCPRFKVSELSKYHCLEGGFALRQWCTVFQQKLHITIKYRSLIAGFTFDRVFWKIQFKMENRFSLKQKWEVSESQPLTSQPDSCTICTEIILAST